MRGTEAMIGGCWRTEGRGRRGLAMWLPEEEEEVSRVKIYVDGGIIGGSGGAGGAAVGAFHHEAD